MKYSLNVFYGFLIFAVQIVSGQETLKIHRPDSHAPIGVMGDHTHEKGEFMVSYRSMHMDMTNLQQGSDRIAPSVAFQKYAIAAKEMLMSMQMIGIMYAPLKGVTLAAMGSYMENDMKLLAKNGMQFSTHSSGFSDVTFTVLVDVLKNKTHRLHLQAGLRLPSGQIDETDVTPMSQGKPIQLPYPMQTGSGSWGTDLGATFGWSTDAISGGVQAKGTFFLNQNAQTYTLGNQYLVTTWLAKKCTDWLSLSLRGEMKHKAMIDGQSPLLMPMMIHTADPAATGGTTGSGRA